MTYSFTNSVMEKGPARCRASISITSAAGFLCWLGHFACSHSGSVAAHSSNAPCPSYDRPCRVVRRQPGETLLHFREVQRLCCDRYWPCRLRKFSSPWRTNRPDSCLFLKVTEWCHGDLQKFHARVKTAACPPSVGDLQQLACGSFRIGAWSGCGVFHAAAQSSTRSGVARAGPIRSRIFTGTLGSYA